MKARIHIYPKQGVLDPQGAATLRALQSMGFKSVEDVRQGKLIEVTLSEKNPETAREDVTKMCDKLLANGVIEDYRIDL